MSIPADAAGAARLRASASWNAFWLKLRQPVYRLLTKLEAGGHGKSGSPPFL
jgi:hypothetical protein